MRFITLVLISIILFILDLTLIPFFTISGAYASLLFIFASIYVISDEYDYALILGLVTGFLQDIYTPYGFGLNIFLNIIIFIIFVRIGKSIKRDKKFINILVVSLGQAIKYLIVYAVYKIYSISSDFNAIVPIFLYSLILSFIIYNMVEKFKRIPFIKREWKF
ncbi:MAG: rod shape-determining protein MreD [Clostridium sp.]|nr:rod shape-determining protein MreD [Clostridium sp.]